MTTIAIAKVGRVITLEKAIKKKGKKISKVLERKIRVITLQEKIEKSQILHNVEKNLDLDRPIIVSHFGFTNNIFASCNYFL